MPAIICLYVIFPEIVLDENLKPMSFDFDMYEAINANLYQILEAFDADLYHNVVLFSHFCFGFRFLKKLDELIHDISALCGLYINYILKITIK